MTPIMNAVLPEPGYWRRTRVYLAEMYPVPSRLALAVLLYLSLAALLREAHGVSAPQSVPLTLVGIFSVFAVGLLARLMDEIKDKEIDQRLFPGRPLPSGKVLDSDIVVSLAGVTALYLTVNLWAGPAFWIALAILAYALLMFRHFFMREILERSLPLTLATHNLIVPVIFLYIVTLVSIDQGLTWGTLNWPAVILAVLMYWAMCFAVEIARKIRAPEEETAYVTYSQIWGPRAAVLVAAGAQTVTLGIGIYFYSALSLSPAYLSILVAGYAMIWWGHLRFLIRPTPATSKLNRFAGAYVFMVLLAHGLELGFLA